MSELWKDAAALLRKAAATIEARSSLRDSEDEADLIDVTAQLADVDSEVVLEVLMALKSARFGRAGDFDSAVDLLAYQARHLAQGIEQPPRTVEVPVYAGVGPVDHNAEKAQICEASALIQQKISLSTTGPAFDAPEVFDDEVPLNHGTAVGDKL